MTHRGQTAPLSDCLTLAVAAAAVLALAGSARGSTDEKVSCVQTRLTQQGFDPGPIDGALGDATLTALEAFLRTEPPRSPRPAPLTVETAAEWCTYLGGVPAPSLRQLAAERGLLIGTAVDAGPFESDPLYRSVIPREFSVAVASRVFKFSELHPSPTEYSFAAADALVEFAATNGMVVRGHVLVWHNRIPEWLVDLRPSRDEAIAILREHIATVVGRYRGRIKYWDVVNEAIDNETLALRTDSFWYQAIGPDYIRLAFEFAHEADPDAVLYYNDYGAEGLGRKSTAVYELVRDLVADGVPIGGVGWQMHVRNGFRVTPDHVRNGERINELGLEVSITELDVADRLPTSEASLASQAAAYQDIVRLCLDLPDCPAVVVWGFTDRYSWIPSFSPGYGNATMFDGSFLPKPAYYAALRALRGAPPVD